MTYVYVHLQEERSRWNLSLHDELIAQRAAWPPNSSLANLVIYGGSIKKSTFCHINDLRRCQKGVFEDSNKDMFLEVQNETCS